MLTCAWNRTKEAEISGGAECCDNRSGWPGKTPHPVPAEEEGTHELREKWERIIWEPRGRNSVSGRRNRQCKGSEARMSLTCSRRRKKGCVAGQALLKGRQRPQGGVCTWCAETPWRVLSTESRIWLTEGHVNLAAAVWSSLKPRLPVPWSLSQPAWLKPGCPCPLSTGTPYPQTKQEVLRWPSRARGPQDGAE